MAESKTDKIRHLNDTFRKTRAGGRVVVTAGIDARGLAFVAEALSKVASFDAFSRDNDPYNEHDFGSFEIEGEQLFWKIEYYDATLSAGSEDPADAAQTTRVLTVMFASEY